MKPMLAENAPANGGRGAAGKTVIMGLKERDGCLVTETIPNVRKGTLRDVVLRNVVDGSIASPTS